VHASAYAFAVSALTAADVGGKRVLEAGSCDVNGSVRPHAESLGPASYTGVDISPGPRVDLVMDAAAIPERLGRDCADVVISTEMLEHAGDWQAVVRGLIAAVAPGGLLVLTTRSAGFPYHPYPEDHWRYSVEAMGEIVKAAGLDILRLEPDIPASPGVFCKARKPAGWTWPERLAGDWAAIEVTRP
jgi:SAM-dependent methyltransferase